MSITAAKAGTTSSYTTYSGTSMATPFTSGTVALMLQANPSLTAAGVKTIFSTTATDRGPAGKDNDWGWGLLDGHAAVADAAAAAIVPTAFPTYTTTSGSVPDGGTWTYTFDVAAADLDVPIAATILIDGSLVCRRGAAVWCDLFGGWEWDPDLEARLLDPGSAVLAVSECPSTGDCGTAGRQETLHAMPTAAGTYTIEVYTAGGVNANKGGSFGVYVSTGPVGAPDTIAPAAPTGLLASAGDGLVALDWTSNAEADLASY